MSRNTHCQALLQRNKHNEQQSHIHVILRNLGNQSGKTAMWGNPKRERDFISFGKVISTASYNFQQENTSYNTQWSHNNLPRNPCQIHTVVWPSFAGEPWKMCQTTVVRHAPARPCCSKKHSKRPRNLCPQSTSKSVTSSLFYKLYKYVQYDLLSIINISHFQT
jgi:hypothetical protein